MVSSLGQLLIQERTTFVNVTVVNLSPQSPHYTGKVVILIDEVTQSQAEYTTMAFRTAPGAVVIGSTTAGADGNVSLIPMPGAQSSLIIGIAAERDELVETAIRIIREQ